ncbi:hypothetical protein CERZMDRAFT_95715 [Cercospora zeae-maydis SCOH1-5]|uniref:BTB domain-containing protein n=1 Tax=Cercospora zeae-maydis SCOH1-5 TaxID=717836 RepID=A0A6A6FLW4_9PEZI|nr:hypothetical protein CERZMDRAFT_95715 [Cercospora zeae-maydis SCOH1-5]
MCRPQSRFFDYLARVNLCDLRTSKIFQQRPLGNETEYRAHSDAYRRPIEEVKQRIHFICDEAEINNTLDLFGGDQDRSVWFLDAKVTVYRKRGTLSTLLWYLGDKPARTYLDTRDSREYTLTKKRSADDIIVSVHVENTAKVPPAPLKVFQIHQSILCESSEFLKLKAKPEWSRGKAEVNLPHVSADAFAVYVNWLYFSRVMPRGEKLWERGSVADSRDWRIFAESVALGEELMDSSFQHSVMDLMAVVVLSRNPRHNLSHQELHRVVQKIYDGTPEDSGARGLIVDIFKGHAGVLRSCGDNELPAAFLRTLALALLDKTPSLAERLKSDRCWYHNHGDGEDCHSTTPGLPGVAAFFH